MQLHIHSLKAGGAPSVAGSGPGDRCCSEQLPVHVAALVLSLLCIPSQEQNSWSEAVVVFISIMGGHIARVLMPCERTDAVSLQPSPVCWVCSSAALMLSFALALPCLLEGVRRNFSFMLLVSQHTLNISVNKLLACQPGCCVKSWVLT